METRTAGAAGGPGKPTGSNPGRAPRPHPTSIPGLTHQLRCQHLLRDLADAAGTYPGAHWPVQITQAVQGLTHAANQARDQDLAAIPADVLAPLEKAFRHGVLLGLKEVREIPGRKQQPFRELLQCLRDRQADVLRFTTDLRIPPDLQPGRTRPAASQASRRSPAGSAAKPPPGTATPSAATWTPPSSTASAP